MSDGDVRDYRSLGEILREAREKKGWSLEELHERTRIAPRMVQALEADDIDQFDSPVYARGFVRQLAGPLGLDPDWLLTKLGVPQRSPEEPPAAVLPPETPATPPPTPVAPPTAPPVSERGPVWEVESVRVRKVEADGGDGIPWRWIVGIAVVLAIVVVGAVLVRQYGGAADETPRAARPIPADESAAAETTAAPSAAGENGAAASTTEMMADAEPDAPADRELVAETVARDPQRRADAGLEWHPSTAPAETPPPRVEAEAEAETEAEAAAETEAEETEPEPERSAAQERPDDPIPVESERSAVTREAPDRGGRERSEVVESEGLDRGLPSVVRGETTPAVTPMRLVVTARSRVEIDITGSDGERERRTLEAGEQWILTGTDHFLVRASDPEAADFELDGIMRDPPPRWSGTEWFLHRRAENDRD